MRVSSPVIFLSKGLLQMARKQRRSDERSSGPNCGVGATRRSGGSV